MASLAVILIYVYKKKQSTDKTSIVLNSNFFNWYKLKAIQPSKSIYSLIMSKQVELSLKKNIGLIDSYSEILHL